MTGLTLWLTGLSGAGKSTVARLAVRALRAGGWPAYVLDGDRMRLGLNVDLGFSARDRDENQRRIAHVACLLADAGLIVLVATISPLAAHRVLARSIHERVGICFHEVYLDTPLAVCERRDPKGLYVQARAGIISGFTGIDSVYEVPERPDLHLCHMHDVDVLAERVARYVTEDA